jgi:hypothetical protein
MSNEIGRSSPRGGKRGCLCKNGTYDKKCCDGSLQAQGIGNTYGQTITITSVPASPNNSTHTGNGGN